MEGMKTYKSRASETFMKKYNSDPAYRERHKAQALARYYRMRELAALAVQNGLSVPSASSPQEKSSPQ